MSAKPIEIIRFIGRSSKRIAVSAVGGVLVLAGVAMLVLPGPGIVVVALGFGVLGTEYAWAASALERAKRTATQAGGLAKDGAGRVVRKAEPARSLGRRITKRPARTERSSEPSPEESSSIPD